jgi:hypothetical protein
MDTFPIIIIVLAIITVTYWLTKPAATSKKSPGRPKKSKTFGNGLLIDNNAQV